MTVLGAASAVNAAAMGVARATGSVVGAAAYGSGGSFAASGDMLRAMQLSAAPTMPNGKSKAAKPKRTPQSMEQGNGGGGGGGSGGDSGNAHVPIVVDDLTTHSTHTAAHAPPPSASAVGVARRNVPTVSVGVGSAFNSDEMDMTT
jgi:hypothetical protein